MSPSVETRRTLLSRVRPRGTEVSGEIVVERADQAVPWCVDGVGVS